MPLEEKYLNTLCVSFAKDFDISLGALSKKLKVEIDQNDLMKDLNHFDQAIDDFKRKETGSYYTPEYIAEYMVNTGIIEYFLKNSSMSKKRLTSIFYGKKYAMNEDEFRSVMRLLTHIKIIDIASGTGIFLVKYFEVVKQIIDGNAYFISENTLKCVANRIYAVDINPIALSIIQLKINWIFQPKSMDDFIEIQSIEMNSVTNEKFHSLLPKESFDIVIGNPPYIGEKGNKPLFNTLKRSSFGKKYYEGRMDIFYYFIYRGIHLLSNKGLLIYLTTNYFITADGAKKLRKFLKNQGHFNHIIDFGNQRIFKDALGQHNMIFSYEKSITKRKTLITKLSENQVNDGLKGLLSTIKSMGSSYEIDHHALFDNRNNIQLLENIRHNEIIKIIETHASHLIKDFFHVNQGIVSGADTVSNYHLNKKLSPRVIKEFNLEKGLGIFALDSNECEVFKSKGYLKKFYKNSNIQKFSINHETTRYILYIDDKIKLDLGLKKHLLPYKEILDQRREVKKGIRKWYALQWPRKKEIFECEKIVLPQRSYNNTFAYSDEDFFASADVYYITRKFINSIYPIKILLGLLNSKLYYLYLYNVGKKKGKMLELYATPLKHIRIPSIDESLDIEPVIDRLINNFNQKDFEILNQWVYEIFNLEKRMIALVEEFYSNHNKNFE